jgi:hypothetical protein
LRLEALLSYTRNATGVQYKPKPKAAFFLLSKKKSHLLPSGLIAPRQRNGRTRGPWFPFPNYSTVSACRAQVRISRETALFASVENQIEK